MAERISGRQPTEEGGAEALNRPGPSRLTGASVHPLLSATHVITAEYFPTNTPSRREATGRGGPCGTDPRVSKWGAAETWGAAPVSTGAVVCL